MYIMVRIFPTDTEALALPLQSNLSLSTANDASNISPPQGLNSTGTVALRGKMWVLVLAAFFTTVEKHLRGNRG